jgi:hypothetical protein
MVFVHSRKNTAAVGEYLLETATAKVRDRVCSCHSRLCLKGDLHLFENDKIAPGSPLFKV